MLSLYRKKYAPLILLFLIFVIPIVTSGVLYYYQTSFHFKTLNRGTLIKPPIQVNYVKKWHIIYVANKICDARCHKHQHNLSQLKKALGKDGQRVDVILLTQNNVLTPNTIYLVDPLGNAFLSYPREVDPMDILHDLKRVLEVSQIG